MKKIYYNKLCRDKIPGIIKEKGFECETRIVENEEYKKEITRKIIEEASGVSSHSSHERLLKELADLIITIGAVKKAFDISEEEMQKYVDESLDKKGGYNDKLYISWSSDTEYSSHDHGQGMDD